MQLGWPPPPNRLRRFRGRLHHSRRAALANASTIYAYFSAANAPNYNSQVPEEVL